MSENWNRFEPFKLLQKAYFTFNPTRFEIWKGGKMIKNGSVESVLYTTVQQYDNEEYMVVNFDEINLANEISSELFFDIFITAADRLQMLTIPNVTNSENIALNMFKMTIGPTRDFKNFNSQEPFCCNLFFKDNQLNKITFSFSNPEKLLELYL